MGTTANTAQREPWNRGKIVGQKAPFKLKDLWALRVRLQMEGRVRELALFNRGIDSKLTRMRSRRIRAVQLLLGHSKLESTVRYLGIEVDDALEISEHTEI